MDKMIIELIFFTSSQSKMKILSIKIFILFASFSIIGQDYFPVNGPKSKNNNFTFLKNAVIHVSFDQVIEKGDLILQDGKIVNVGTNLVAPKNSVKYDLNGKHIYCSFIELFSSIGLPEPKKKKRPDYPQYTSSKKGPYYWNESIHPEYNAINDFSYDTKKASLYINKGFGLVLSHAKDGISRGTGFLLALNKQKNKNIISGHAGSFLSFKKGSSTQVYPTSLMGCIALLRQFYYDMEWYSYQTIDDHEDLSIKAMIKNESLPQFFITDNHLDISRALNIGKEFGLKYIVKGGGDEYKSIQTIKSSNTSLIVPIDFPKPFDVEDPYDASKLSTSQLLHWYNAPKNLAYLEKHNVPFSITSTDLTKKDFLKNIRTAVSHGLSKEMAYKALTQFPAELLKLDDKIGTLEKGKWANFIITSDELFEENGEILENWVQGERTIIQRSDLIDTRGKYNLNTNQNIRTLIVEGDLSKPKAHLEYNIIVDSISKQGDLVLDKITGKPYKLTVKKNVPVTINIEDQKINLSYFINDGLYRLSGNINYNSGSWDGNGKDPEGSWLKWTAIKNDDIVNQSKKNILEKDTLDVLIKYPMSSYGLDSIPYSNPILIRNTTIWTSEEAGVLENADILIRDGKITHIGEILDVVDKNTIIIDGTGKHLTAGLIDEHSHIAISRGVNEGSHAISAEVNLNDVINPNDINIYRQLAGGVTTSQLLHGSANPIGGQSAIIKLRWGANAENMKFQNAPKFIKFALGENVKQSNWGDKNVTRYPQTRMGVEQVYYDAFIRAREYEAKWNNYYNSKKKNKYTLEKPRKDIQLETLLEILNEERFITCHSYVQSEINMLMKVADSMGFTVNTFTHILEGYKIADKMKSHGVGGSTFSDWWAYKYEVKDAIPHNASILNAMGIVTAINSDDAEMGRRLNQEAAKGIKYGGMSAEDALKMVTINPAKLLHLDDRIGSIKVGKDADLVIWSGHPLSVYSKVEKTYIDGIQYYDSNDNSTKQKELQKIRSTIIAEMIMAKKAGKKVQTIKELKPKIHVCGTLNDDGN